MYLNSCFPFYDMSKTLAEVDRVFNTIDRPARLHSARRGVFPAINVYSQGDATVMIAEVPGVDPNALELTVLDDTVTLKGDRGQDIPEQAHIYRQERLQGGFSRTITLPDSVDPESVKAEYHNGVLRVTMDKAEAVKAKRIEIQG